MSSSASRFQDDPVLIRGERGLSASEPFFGLVELAQPGQQVHVEDQVHRLAAAIFQNLPHLGLALRPVALSRAESGQKEPVAGDELLGLVDRLKCPDRLLAVTELSRKQDRSNSLRIPIIRAGFEVFLDGLQELFEFAPA